MLQGAESSKEVAEAHMRSSEWMNECGKGVCLCSTFFSDQDCRNRQKIIKHISLNFCPSTTLRFFHSMFFFKNIRSVRFRWSWSIGTGS